MDIFVGYDEFIAWDRNYFRRIRFMLKILRNSTDINNIHTYFEFCEYDGWDEYDTLRSVLTNELGCRVVEELDGIYSRHCDLAREKDNFAFKLMYHEDFGNCLCNQELKDDIYYNELENIANEVAAKIEQ
jgi:hypothetical protein